MMRLPWRAKQGKGDRLDFVGQKTATDVVEVRRGDRLGSEAVAKRHAKAVAKDVAGGEISHIQTDAHESGAKSQ